MPVYGARWIASSQTLLAMTRKHVNPWATFQDQVREFEPIDFVEAIG